MKPSQRNALLAVATVLLAAPASAQAPSLAGEQSQPVSRFSLSPYFGIVYPTADLLSLGAGTTAQDIKLSTAITVGGRLGVMFSSHVGLMADVGYSPGSLEYAASQIATNTDITTLTGVGKLVVYVIPADKWVSFSVSGGAGMIQHKFKKGGAAALSGLKDGTNVGGVVGATLGIRLGKIISLTGSVEDYLYNASFDNNGSKTAERKQNDLRFTGGIHLPFIGM